MTQYNCINGQSFSDVCLNTYGSMDNYVKLLNDNGISPNDIPVSGQVVMWDETLVTDQSILQQTNNNKTQYATLQGLINPPQFNPAMSTYKDPLSTEYTASGDDETLITLTELQNSELVQIEKEIKPMSKNDYLFNPVNGTITLLNGKSLVKGESLFILYKKTVAQ